MSNLVVLRHKVSNGHWISVRTKDRAAELADIARHGDTLHTVSLDLAENPAGILAVVNEQYRAGAGLEVS